MRGKVDASGIAWVVQHGGESAGEAEWLIGGFAQDEPGIGRSAPPIAVELHGCVPDRREVQWGRERGWYGSNTGKRVGLGTISVHGDALLKMGLVGSPIIGR